MIGGTPCITSTVTSLPQQSLNDTLAVTSALISGPALSVASTQVVSGIGVVTDTGKIS